MARWTSDVFKWIKPHHLFETIKNPQRALRELKYRYTFTTKNRFIEDILVTPQSSVLEVFQELYKNGFSSTIRSRINQHNISAGRGAMGDEAELLYACARLTKPAVIVETGVGSGFSTAHTLKALQMNEHGMLYSIDYYEKDEQCGWVIPSKLRNRWKLTRGLSSDTLAPLLNELGSIDVFFHDSDHSYENMMMEFRTAWPYLKAGGIFLAHDVGRNDSLFDFAREVNLPLRKIRTYPVLAGFKKS